MKTGETKPRLGRRVIVATCPIIPSTERAAAGDETLKGAPYLAPMKRLDETQAARKPVLKWTPPSPDQLAAE